MPQSPLNVKWTPTRSQNAKSSDAIAMKQQEHAPTHASPYEETQAEEVLALRAIFMDDFEDVETKNAWSKMSQMCFKLHLKASSYPDVGLALGVTLTATYPKSIPLLHLEDIKGLRQKGLERVQSIIRSLPLELVGEVMINEIAVNVQDSLEDTAVMQAKESLMPSLEQERVESEAAAARIALEKEAEQRRLQEEEQAEEDRVMQRMLDEELKRRRDARRRRDLASADLSSHEPSRSLSTSSNMLTFDQPIHILGPDATDLSFRSITMLGTLATGRTTDVYTACPLLKSPSPICLVLKRAKLINCKRKDAILALEDELEKLKNLQHSNIVNILDFKIHNQDLDWNIDVLTEHATNSSMRDMLQIVDSLAPNKARPLAIDLLQGLDFYHKNGFVHGRVHSGNILLTALPNGATLLKLADAAFQETLHSLKEDSKERARSNRKELSTWRAPELATSSTAAKTRKTDVWDFGIVFVEMLFGPSAVQKFTSPQTFLNAAGLSDPLEDMMREVLRPDPKRRPNAFDIIPYEFLRTDAPTVGRSVSPLHSRTTSSAGFNAATYLLPRHDSQHTSSTSRSIGTTLYVAPELRSNVSGHYTDKVDMYSLGIMLFEMCFPLKTGMERYHMLSALREREHRLPDDFSSSGKQIQGDIILSLIKHRPSERPSSAELLRSGKLPVQVEDETIRLALHGLSDPNSPYYHKMLSALFSQSDARQIKDQMWEMSGEHSVGQGAVEYMLLQGMVKDRMIACFRRHGAVESHRQTLFPRSDYYLSTNVVQLLDASGTLVQLPYDLTLPHARAIAKEASVPERSFTFGTVFREAATGYAPRGGREADFDLVSHNVIDNALREAEVIKVMDEIIDELPSFSRTPMCYHVNHARLLDIILDSCRIASAQRAAAKAVMGKLNLQSWTWVKIRTELRAPAIAISSTSLDELAQFDFRDSIKKSYARLQVLLPDSHHREALDHIFRDLQELDTKLKLLGVKRHVYWSPLSSFNDTFYRDAVMFQCLFDGKKRDVLAAGGRYDSLVEDHRPKYAGGPNSRRQVHAVGINIVWDRLITSMLRYQKQGGAAFLKKGEEADKSQWTPRRCDCLVASFDPKTLRTTGLKILSELWANDISAELAVDARLPEELLSHYRDEKHSWIIIVKHDVSAVKPDIKVKNMDKREDVDIRSSELMSYMRGEIRDRDQREGMNERAKLARHASVPEPAVNEKMGSVTVLQTNLKRKVRVNKWRAVEAAQTRAAELAASMTDGAPIASIEVRDEILDMIRDTRLSDPDSWRKIIHDVPLADRDYVQQVHDLLMKFKFQHSEATRNSFLYSFKTGSCIYYDLRL
ncbi:hypothetical protein FH972_023487 [Carpinus fangiana]|uniref:non-specific serine/threonine protein kinase n=1 Tax=Carpinus fangiana TaxID=176857 RepID=A0A5N6KXL2_9ROSI|nr:hypothetical protein FH972_023487 [Carpinus fangiana]